MKRYQVNPRQLSALMAIWVAACATPKDDPTSGALSQQTPVPTPLKAPSLLPPNPCVLNGLQFSGGGGSSCTEDDCGSNTPYINGYHIDELHLVENGMLNHDDVQYIDFELNGGQPAVLKAERGELYAEVSTPNGIKRRAGCELLGSTLHIERNNNADTIHIYGYRRDDSWVAGSNIPIHNYLLTYESIVSNMGGFPPTTSFVNKPICHVADSTASEDLAWAVVLTDERYRHDSAHTVLPRVVPQPIERGWLNFACQGHALNKARHWEYYPDADAGAVTTASQREAMLDSITATYCEDQLEPIFTNFTEDGVALAWRNGSGTVDTTVLYTDDVNQYRLELEAIWGQDGLICLQQPRLASLQDIELACGAAPPQCTQLNLQGWPPVISPEDLAAPPWPAPNAQDVEVATYIPVAVQ